MELSDEEERRVFRRIAIYFGTLDPQGSMRLEYMTEGAANIVWNIRFEGAHSNLSKHDKTCVLRMRKDLAFTVSSTTAVQQFEERIAPLFLFDPSLLLPVQLCEMSNTTVTKLNEQLHVLEQNEVRPAHRRHIYQPSFFEEPYAVIMPNLGHGEGQIVEFKPKWLSQSPSAPKGAQRCRTCALNAMRRNKGVAQGRGDSGFCPFDLLSSHDEILRFALRQIWKDEQTLSGFVDAFRETVQPALRQLQRLQREHNEVGLKDFEEPEGKDFSVAMALRDCSMFLKVLVHRTSNGDGADTVEISLIKLLDLDLKDAGGGKLAKWASMEREMIEGGWYTAEGNPDVRCAMTFQ